MKKVCWFAFVTLALVLFACGNESQPPGTEEENTAAQQPASLSGGDAAAAEIKGIVAETMDVSSYTYIRLDDGSGTEIWAAVPRTALRVGQEVTLRGSDMVMEDFYSKTLDRTFEKLIFATGVSFTDGTGYDLPGAADLLDQSAGQTGAGASGGSAANVVPFLDLKVEKAEGPNGYSVGDLFDNASSLDGTAVVVRGQVVKISRDIMDRNWIHIQDGSGNQDTNTHDLVVTTLDEAENGDIVIVEGQVAADKDFGFGYKYDVIIEDARIRKVAGTEAGTI